jgi:hypothetical protein
MSHGSKKRRYEREVSIHFEEEFGIGVTRPQVSKDADCGRGRLMKVAFMHKRR